MNNIGKYLTFEEFISGYHYFDNGGILKIIMINNDIFNPEEVYSDHH